MLGIKNLPPTRDPANGGEKDKELKPEKPTEDMYFGTLRDIKEGEIIKGKIVGITKNEILVDVGYKSEGVISIDEFNDPKSLVIGAEIEVLLESKENEEGMIVLSKRKAEKTAGWERIITDYKEGDTITGRAIKQVKGGMMVDIGVEAFLPASQAFLKGPINLNQLIGQQLDYKIIKINKPRKNVVLSRRDVLLKQKEDERIKLIQGLKVGEIKQGVVKNITDFGAFVNLGGIDGLLHITDMSWGRLSHPSEILAVGDKIDVMILGFDKDNARVSLGLKQTTTNPWQAIESKYPVGSRVKGTVVNIVPYGAFVELEKGIEGLVHISELSWTKRIAHPSEVLAMGDVIEAIVLGIDKENQKISLGIKQTEANPWEEAVAKFPVGAKVKGKVRNLTEYGAFIELDDNLDGLIHISDMSWTKKINHPSEILKKSQKIEAVVLAVDAQSKKLSLGLKQLTPNPWPQILEKYPVGTEVEGTITKIVNFGLFVEIEKDLEGLLHISELPSPVPEKLEDSYKVDDKVKAKILKVEQEQRKIALTMK